MKISFHLQEHPNLLIVPAKLNTLNCDVIPFPINIEVSGQTSLAQGGSVEIKRKELALHYPDLQVCQVKSSQPWNNHFTTKDQYYL